MTCIAGIVGGDGTVHIGGDSAGVGNWELGIRADEKVFVNGSFAMGFTTSFRMGQLLHYKLCLPKRGDETLHRYMMTSFVDAVRSCLKDGGFAKKDKEVEEGGEFLVGHDGHLFRVFGDYQVAEFTKGFNACGCGGEAARGALFVLERNSPHTTPRAKLRVALEAAEHVSAGVRRPFRYVSVRKP